LANSTDVVIEGVTVMHATGWDVKMLGLKRVHIKNIKVIAWRCWNDGIDVDVSTE
jgi:polygalacturonase